MKYSTTIIVAFALLVFALYLSSCTETKTIKTEIDLSTFEYVQFYWNDTTSIRIASQEIASASEGLQGGVWYWKCTDKQGTNHIFILNNLKRIVVRGDW